MSIKKERVLILGITGMLGHTLFLEMSKDKNLEVFGTTRSNDYQKLPFFEPYQNQIRPGVDADNFDSISRALAAIEPTIVINCIGLIKQLWWGNDPLAAITVNALLPHRISLICKAAKARLIHIGTDCVFNGLTGNYKDNDPPSAADIYGRSKSLGELSYPHCVTLRSSIIGHELKGNYGLIGWFLNQKESVKGFKRAIFSGFPTIELSHIISEYVIPNKELSGIYNVSSEPISKLKLLQLVKKVYSLNINIEESDDLVIDRSLDSTLFQTKTGYKIPTWENLIQNMFNDYKLKASTYI